MEVKINKEIRNYTESMFFGLSMWQCLMPKKVLFVPENLYYEAMKNAIEAHEKGLPAVQDKKKKKRRRARRQGNGENRLKILWSSIFVTLRANKIRFYICEAVRA